MADRPILFSGPMVRAILDGRKTQTRRVIEPYENAPHPFSGAKAAPNLVTVAVPARLGGFTPGPTFCTRYAPGDRLWVRETFVTGFNIDDELGRPVGDRKVWYRATDSGLTWFDPDTETTLDNPPWKPSVHMPRWASRLTLIVTDVRVQRLRDISEADALAEGVESRFIRPVPGDGSAQTWWFGTADGRLTPIAAFRDLWDSLNAARGYGWDRNPWVCAVTFEAHQRNIDQMGVAA